MVEIIDIDGDFIAEGKRAFKAGAKAHDDGIPKDKNPHEQGSYNALQWGKGWANRFYWSQYEQKPST